MLDSRRHFLKLAAAAPATAIGVFSQTPAASGAAVAAKLRIGFAGTGGRGLNNLHELAGENVAALCDVDARNLAAARRLWPDATVFRDYREMFASPGLDAAVISTPLHTHAHAAAAAMKAGLHVYLEKPLAHSIFESRLLAGLALKHKQLKTQLGNQHHAAAGYRRASEIIASGALGDISAVHCWTSRPIWPQGGTRPQKPQQPPETLDWNLWLGPAPWRPYHESYLPMFWRGWWDFGAGALVDMAPHLLDVVFQNLQLKAPFTVVAETSEVNQEMAPAWSIVKYGFPQRGGLPPLQLTWYDGGKRPGRDITGVARPPSNGVMLLGSKARLFVPQLGRRPVFLPRNAAGRAPASKLPEAAGATLLTHQQQWAAACKSGEATTSPFSDAARNCELTLVGNLAIKTGQAVHWKPASAVKKPQFRKGWEL